MPVALWREACCVLAQPDLHRTTLKEFRAEFAGRVLPVEEFRKKAFQASSLPLLLAFSPVAWLYC